MPKAPKKITPKKSAPKKHAAKPVKKKAAPKSRAGKVAKSGPVKKSPRPAAKPRPAPAPKSFMWRLLERKNEELKKKEAARLLNGKSYAEGAHGHADVIGHGRFNGPRRKAG